MRTALILFLVLRTPAAAQVFRNYPSPVLEPGAKLQPRNEDCLNPIAFGADASEAESGNRQTPGKVLAVLKSTKPGDFGRRDFNRNIYYKNRLDFSTETGWLPINIPFVFDFLLGGGYNMTPLKYTLVPNISSLRWQMNDVSGPWILRGNWESSVSGSFTYIPRGPETRFWSYIMGIRRNFVQRNWRVVPYLEGRVGIGNIDAKEPEGVTWAQGQDLTFTLMLSSGMRYTLSPRYAISAGVTYMHISNLYLSEPRFPNYGINVYGPTVGTEIRLGKSRATSRTR